MSEGQALDRLIHEKVMGFVMEEIVQLNSMQMKRSRHEEIPKYSTDIADAWKVVEKMNKHRLNNSYQMVMRLYQKSLSLIEVRFDYQHENSEGDSSHLPLVKYR